VVILLTSIGKRVELINHLKTQAKIVGADCSDLNAARHFADKFYKVPRVDSEDYLNELIRICRNERVDYLIPLLENEFELLAKNRDAFSAVGTTLVLSDEKIVNICKDKRLTAEFFNKYDIPAPETYKFDKSNADTDLLSKTPLVIKPACGMGSDGVYIVEDELDLKYALKHVEDPIIQEKLSGREFTMDVLCDKNGEIIYLVTRERLEVRSGEVNKSKVTKVKSVVDISRKVMEALKQEGSIFGPFTLQCFLDENGEAKMLEINPRFGGGVPLSFEAGADYAGAFKDMLENKQHESKPISEITMLRYDQSVFID
jgi:carbamoyl-phosphate synthase large subunit